jgi:uncharacterized protein DUF4953/uncharacterized protein DUF5117
MAAVRIHPLPVALLISALALISPPVEAKDAPSRDAFAEKTKSAIRRSGLLVTWLDPKAGTLMLELPKPSGPRGECGRFLYLEAIRTGLGSNPVGLDRGQSGEARVVVFRRVGGRVLLEQPNLRYRAQSADSSEVRAVHESFAVSILWGAEVAAEAPDGRLLADFTSFVVRDAHRAAAAMRGAGQGAFALDKERSALDAGNCPSFPDNLEFESLLTFASEEPGGEIRATAPTPQAVTIVQHQSLVRLPDDRYRPRAWDPRSGSFDVLFADYARPIASDLEVRWLVRHRLERLDPAAARSRVKKPIVYYVDPGAPEPIRSALLEGASWWAAAFEEAGFIDAFQVKLLPPDADPLDVRYHVIQWVHRATRGWSYGGGIVDPRTGEMIKGQVTLGSLRIRQDRMIFEGLAGTEKTGSGAPDDPVQLGLARIRQLAAHEVGHTLGFAHNFVASTYAGRGSVMDYPAPLIGIREDGTLDFSKAYATGIGAWDIQQVRYAYTEFATPADERAGLAAILRENHEKGYRFLSDADTRPASAAHPLAAMWDNGNDPVAELAHELEVRRLALARFGERNVTPGSALGTLNEVLVPLYYHHRYQLEATAKSIGGLEYAYTVRGEGSERARPVPAARQRAALEAVLGTLDPGVLDLPESLLVQLVPIAADYPPRHEFFDSRTAPAFDALGAAATAADMTLAALLPPERLARLVDFHRRDPAMPGVEDLLGALVRRVFAPATAPPRLQELRRTVQAVAVRRLMVAAADPAQTPAARAAIERALQGLGSRLGAVARPGESAADLALRELLARDIRRFLTRPVTPVATGPATPGAPPDLPPGPPIGSHAAIGGWDAADECEWSPGGGPR